MDYHNLNDQTVKNNYLLPLITDLIDNMGSKKVFTKIDLRWEFVRATRAEHSRRFLS